MDGKQFACVAEARVYLLSVDYRHDGYIDGDYVYVGALGRVRVVHRGLLDVVLQVLD